MYVMCVYICVCLWPTPHTILANLREQKAAYMQRTSNLPALTFNRQTGWRFRSQSWGAISYWQCRIEDCCIRMCAFTVCTSVCVCLCLCVYMYVCVCACVRFNLLTAPVRYVSERKYFSRTGCVKAHTPTQVHGHAYNHSHTHHHAHTHGHAYSHTCIPPCTMHLQARARLAKPLSAPPHPCLCA